MEILYTWSWPLPKDSPALQREPLLMAVCSADGCIGGDRGKKEPRAIQQAAGHGEEHFSVLLSAGRLYKIAAEKTIGHLLHPRKACSDTVGQEGPQGSPITSGMRCKSSRTHPFPGCPAPRGQPREINPPNIPLVQALHGATSQNSRRKRSEKDFCHQSIPDSSAVPAAVF